MKSKGQENNQRKFVPNAKYTLSLSLSLVNIQSVVMHQLACVSMSKSVVLGGKGKKKLMAENPSGA